ncbi:response regulator transcription factor [Macrococcoides bohemicum]|uniref:Heme response regulator HssR n=1 Tax=Macrococcoides bohemicum TaxID=1903056 RepID=A0A328A5V6_9STAP|nr:response regulator transcription factor [Macrococcus bohemicus]RAK49835.1 DNA-binding response regulator [Macrococcus bohemicus]
MKNKILIVDDEQSIRNQVVEGFIKHHYEVFSAESGEVALKVLENEKIDLCVVDIMMPGMNGFELCETIKESYQLPVIMLTARDALGDKRIAFETGSDDYVTKPFEFDELLFRANAILKRYNLDITSIKIGNVELDQDTYELHIHQDTLYLPRKEFELLYYLVKHQPNIATREQLIEAIWGLDFEGDERTVDVHIKRIRKRLENYDTQMEIVTVRGLGYKVHHV